jgi:hypothetical protein
MSRVGLWLRDGRLYATSELPQTPGAIAAPTPEIEGTCQSLTKAMIEVSSTTVTDFLSLNVQPCGFSVQNFEIGQVISLSLGWWSSWRWRQGINDVNFRRHCIPRDARW